VFECRVEPLHGQTEIDGSIGVAVDVTARSWAERDALFAFDEAVHCIVRAIEERDIVTGAHVERMSDYCALIGDEIGMNVEQRQAIAIASRLHDIGKIAVPDGILLKGGKLTDEERRIMQRHCQVGHDVLAASHSRILRLAAQIALTHHEWFDGSGYPKGLAGEDIPLSGRIAAIADSFDALTSDRPYRPAMPFDEARRVMLEERGTHFDPHLLDVFLSSPGLPRLHREHP
jgi:putative two-component system response regulator